MSSEQENKFNHLEELAGSDYKIVEGEPDITGWDVIDAEGRKIGDVDDVLFDPQTRAVRYIIVDLDDNELEIDTDKKVLVPIGIAELSEGYDADIEDDDNVEETGDSTLLYPEKEPVHEVGSIEDIEEVENDDFDEDFVYLPSVTVEHLMALPAYESGNVSPEQEVTIRNIFERPAVSDALIVYEKDNFYTHDHFNNRIYPGNDADNDSRSNL